VNTLYKSQVVSLHISQMESAWYIPEHSVLSLKIISLQKSMSKVHGNVLNTLNHL
jgi:hypothetical protein